MENLYKEIKDAYDKKDYIFSFATIMNSTERIKKMPRDQKENILKILEDSVDKSNLDIEEETLEEIEEFKTYLIRDIENYSNAEDDIVVSKGIEEKSANLKSKKSKSIKWGVAFLIPVIILSLIFLFFKLRKDQVVGVELEGLKDNIQVGDELSLDIDIKLKSGKMMDHEKLKVQSSNKNAKIIKNKTLKALKEGESEIQVYYDDDLVKTYSIEIEDKFDLKDYEVYVDYISDTLKVGDTDDLEVIIEDFEEDIDNLEIEYKSSNNEVLSVNQLGKIKAISPGKAKVYVTIENVKIAEVFTVIEDDDNDTDVDEKADVDAATNEYIIGDSDVRIIDYNELLHLSDLELAIARNEIYARHGFKFDKEPYVSYFNSKSWYSVDPNFLGVDEELSSVEIENREKILKREVEINSKYIKNLNPKYIY